MLSSGPEARFCKHQTKSIIANGYGVETDTCDKRATVEIIPKNNKIRQKMFIASSSYC